MLAGGGDALVLDIQESTGRGGVKNTGGGGGGETNNKFNYGKGGSGIVLIAYPT